MERSKGPSLASPFLAVKPEPNRLRKKLQKPLGIKQRNYLSKRPGSGLSGSLDESMENKAESTARLSSTLLQGSPRQVYQQQGQQQSQQQSQQNQQNQQNQQQPSIPLPPDLSDSKWLDYLRGSGFFYSMEQEQPNAAAAGVVVPGGGAPPSSTRTKETRRIPMLIVPEFAHLAASNDGSNNSSPASSTAPRRSPNPSFLDSPASSTSTIMRRRAKTPVFSIGQLEAANAAAREAREGGGLERGAGAGAGAGASGLGVDRFSNSSSSSPLGALAGREGAPLPLRLQPSTGNKTSSVELIAEQYRALLESRCSMLTDSHSEPPPSRLDDMYYDDDDDDNGDEHTRTSDIETVRRRSSFGVEDPLPTAASDPTSDATHHFAHGADLLRPPAPGPVGAVVAANAAAASSDPAAPSPHSDDGTLVAFEEEAVYFKPVSFSPEAPRSPAAMSPAHNPHHHYSSSDSSPLFLPATTYDDGQQRRTPRTPPDFFSPPYSPPFSPRQQQQQHQHQHQLAVSAPLPPPPQADNLSLQICLDLLTRELSTAMLGDERERRRRGAGADGRRRLRSPLDPDVSALQVWVMIEAYERLRDCVVEMRSGGGGQLGGSERGEDLDDDDDDDDDGRGPVRPPALAAAAALAPVEHMFDVWLRALYTVHDTLAAEAASRRGSASDTVSVSGSEYEVLEAEAEAVD